MLTIDYKPERTWYHLILETGWEYHHHPVPAHGRHLFKKIKNCPAFVWSIIDQKGIKITDYASHDTIYKGI